MPITESLLNYYKTHGRDLPWRRTRDPYAILVSELMLQQTQVSRVMPKWHAWLEKFPTIKSLANSQTSDVLKLWSGLGYNSRALRLRELAIVVMKSHGGKLPKTPEELLELPGIGPYTANAVASFAYDADVLALDTNLKRVLGRYFAKDFAKLTAEQTEKTFPIVRETGRIINGALMDIGSSICGRTPKCAECPLFDQCKTRGRAPFEVVKKQSQKFEESDRCVRGSVMRELLKAHEEKAFSLNVQFLQDQAATVCINVSSERIHKILRAMERSGLIKIKGEQVRLP